MSRGFSFFEYVLGSKQRNKESGNGSSSLRSLKSWKGNLGDVDSPALPSLWYLLPHFTNFPVYTPSRGITCNKGENKITDLEIMVTGVYSGSPDPYFNSLRMYYLYSLFL